MQQTEASLQLDKGKQSTLSSYSISASLAQSLVRTATVVKSEAARYTRVIPPGYMSFQTVVQMRGFLLKYSTMVVVGVQRGHKVGRSVKWSHRVR